MKYLNANDILPKALIEELQKYAQAVYIYVPAKGDTHRRWGELSGYRQELAMRNAAILAEREDGTSIEELAERYHLSIHTIRKIIYKK